MKRKDDSSGSMGEQAMHTGTIIPALRSELEGLWPGRIHWDVSMAGYCTFRTGGKANAVVTVSTLQELVRLLQWLYKNAVSWRVIGRGSNILVRNRGFDGVLIILAGEFNSVDFVAAGNKERKQEVKVCVGAGCSVAKMIGWCTRQEISGLEFMVGIPGSVGGAVRMNAGAWGKEISSCIDSVSYVDGAGNVYELPRDQIGFAYREMYLPEIEVEEIVVVETRFRLKHGRQREIISQCREYMDKRRNKQPIGVASAGSFFKNPPGDSAGRLIDDAGLKGLRRGDAMVSIQHANFIVNTGQASADDIIALMKEVQQKVYSHSGVMLEPEVQVL